MAFVDRINNVRFVRILPRDRQQIDAFVDLCRAATGGLNEEATAQWLDAADGNVYFVAAYLVSGKRFEPPLGYYAFDARDPAHLKYLCIDKDTDRSGEPKRRGRGFGSTLLQHWEESVPFGDDGRVMLTLNAVLTNRPQPFNVVNFYVKNGFCPVSYGRFGNRPGDPSTALMIKTIEVQRTDAGVVQRVAVTPRSVALSATRLREFEAAARARGVQIQWARVRLAERNKEYWQAAQYVCNGWRFGDFASDDLRSVFVKRLVAAEPSEILRQMFATVAVPAAEVSRGRLAYTEHSGGRVCWEELNELALVPFAFDLPD